MKYIKTLVAALVATALFTTSAVAATNTSTVSSAGEWTLTLAGAGSTTIGNNSESVIGAELGVGHTGTVLLPVEVGFRQKFSYASAGREFNHGTKVYFDVTVLRFKSLEVLAGANAGATYGDSSLAWTASPEAEVRLYLKKDVYAFGRAEYPYDITKSEFKDTLDYVLGIGLRF